MKNQLKQIKNLEVKFYFESLSKSNKNSDTKNHPFTILVNNIIKNNYKINSNDIPKLIEYISVNLPFLSKSPEHYIMYEWSKTAINYLKELK